MNIKSIISAVAVESEVAPHLVIDAGAGTGKTTTLIQGLKMLKGEDPCILPSGVEITPSEQQTAIWEAMAESSGARSILFAAFNKAIAEELSNKVPDGVEARTVHSFGYAAVRAAYGYKKPNGYAVRDIFEKVYGKDRREVMKKNPTFAPACEKLCSLVKMNLSDTDSESLAALVSHYDVEFTSSPSEVFDVVAGMIEESKDPTKARQIHFDDMIWLPVVNDLPIPKHDLVLWDEAQDGNRCQQELIIRSAKRLILVGDPNQAIYGFAGADSESMPRMIERLDAQVLKLNETRRCGKAIVAAANDIVPDYYAHEDNSPGEVRTEFFPVNEDDKSSYREGLEAGDMVLCRTNAPLVSECFGLISQGIKANIRGRDIGQGLIKLIKKFKVASVGELELALDDWRETELQKEAGRKNPNEGKMINIEDRYKCLMTFTGMCDSVEEVTNIITEMFTDNASNGGVMFSSGHKAKGLEANRVYILQPKKVPFPHPMAKSEWQRQQEYCLRYVMITRAIDVLTYVNERD